MAIIDQPRASHLAKQAFDFWQSGQLEQAVSLYEEALSLADPKHYGRPDYHGEFAGVLTALGRFPEAQEQLEAALTVQRDLDGNDLSSGVVIARYFLADHFLRQKQPQEAIDTVTPSLQDDVTTEWLLRLVKALALSDLGRVEEAKSEANIALLKAPSEEKRSELMQWFTEKLGEGWH